MRIDLSYSALSRGGIDNVLSQNISFEDALLYMDGELCVRTFADTLSVFGEGSDAKNLLNRMYEIECSLNANANRESVARNIRNWLGGRMLPDRDNLFKICFALGLDVNASNLFLSFSTDGGFHLRNPRELAMAYGLRTGKSYAESAELFARLRPLEISAASGGPVVFTKTIADQFDLVTDEESFMLFYKENYEALGIMHNTAYHKCFMPFINTLMLPDVPHFFEKERKYSVEEVVDAYLRVNTIPKSETANYAAIRRTIRKYWPNASSITKMRNRTEDVTRKVLLLLYLVTGGHRAQDSEQMADEYEMTAAERFEGHFWKLNAMLNDCGFSLLDPRSMFDWLVLFCLKDRDDELISERLQEMLNRIFNTETF